MTALVLSAIIAVGAAAAPPEAGQRQPFPVAGENAGRLPGVPERPVVRAAGSLTASGGVLTGEASWFDDGGASCYHMWHGKVSEVSSGSRPWDQALPVPPRAAGEAIGELERASWRGVAPEAGGASAEVPRGSDCAARRAVFLLRRDGDELPDRRPSKRGRGSAPQGAKAERRADLLRADHARLGHPAVRPSAPVLELPHEPVVLEVLPASGGVTQGEASWYRDPSQPASGLYGAVHSYRWGDRKYKVRVCRTDGAACVTVTVRDHMANRTRAIDLSPAAFSRLAPLSRGIVRVTVTPLGAEPTIRLPETSTED